MIPGGDLPKKGEEVTILWPGGEYDFVIRFDHAEPMPNGWVLLHGLVVQPEGVQHRERRGFYVRPVAGGKFTLHPKLLPTPRRRP
jgi:hypothetical protein